MRRKHVGFDARVSPAGAAETAHALVAPGSAPTDRWVSQGRDEEASVFSAASAGRVAVAVADEPALRIARLMPLWLGFYVFVDAMAQILRPAK